MLAAGLIPILAFGLLALLPMLETTDTSDEDVTEEDPVLEDPEGEEPEGEEPVAADPTTITITDVGGEDRDVVVDGTEAEAGERSVVEGSEQRDVVEVPTNPTVNIQLNTLGGDDAIGFGFSTSVDPGEGSDVLTLDITQEALENGALEFGVITFDDSDDALAIEVDEAAAGFIHEVRVVSSQTVDDTTTTETETIYYVLGGTDTLFVNEEATAETGTLVLEDGTQVLTEIDLGTLTRVTGTNEAGEATETVTGEINEDPTILVNRDVSSEQTITLPTTDAPTEDDEPVEGEGETDEPGEDDTPVEGEGEDPAEPAVTIATDGGEATQAEIVEGRVSGTETSDVITANADAPADLIVDLGNGDDTANLIIGQDVISATDISTEDFDDAGADVINYALSAEAFAAAQATNTAAQSADDFADTSRVELGDADTLTFEIAPEIEGRLIEIITVMDNSGGGGATNDTYTNFYVIVPEETDLVDARDTFPNGTGASVTDFLVENYGAVALAIVPLGNQTAGDPDDGEDPTTMGNRVVLNDVIANRAIEQVSWSLNA